MYEFDNLITAIHTAAAKGQTREALKLAENATRKFPREADTWVLSAVLKHRSGYLQLARTDYEKAYTLRPDDLRLIQELAGVLEQLDAYEDAKNLLDEAISRLPENDELSMMRAAVSAKLGDFESSVAIALQVLERTPDHINAIYSLVTQGLGKEVGGIDGVEARLSSTASGTPEHNSLAYAHARLLEQDKRYDEAFVAFSQANAQQAAAGGMDIKAKQKGASSVIIDLSEDIIKRFSGRGNQSDRPVFIVGMPRSGTTLTEQILAAHPEVYAAGERGFWPAVLHGMISNVPQHKDSMIESIDASHENVWDHAGAQYLRRIEELNTQAKRVTDKLPANFALLPYIRLVFPRAHIIHLKREPLASIASCIRTRFNNPLLSFSAGNWARFYGMYQGMMDHWRPILGEQLLEIDYEDLVRDLPTQSRRLTDFIGLEWHENCLYPERNTRAVNTASIKQVRQGVHTGAIDAWRRWEAQLEALRPLIQESREAVASPAPTSPAPLTQT